ncbi:hypothetical protein Ciccas_012888 [Cichlidogyrus casuarinus]|uniref:Uncharacterized protein n=1 Tax=Cichlidogyrus casuarinus TaxID=1844966 RepID=A0ABD2PPH0_9PLAT
MVYVLPFMGTKIKVTMISPIDPLEGMHKEKLYINILDTNGQPLRSFQVEGLLPIHNTSMTHPAWCHWVHSSINGQDFVSSAIDDVLVAIKPRRFILLPNETKIINVKLERLTGAHLYLYSGDQVCVTLANLNANKPAKNLDFAHGFTLNHLVELEKTEEFQDTLEDCPSFEDSGMNSRNWYHILYEELKRGPVMEAVAYAAPEQEFAIPKKVCQDQIVVPKNDAPAEFEPQIPNIVAASQNILFKALTLTGNETEISLKSELNLENQSSHEINSQNWSFSWGLTLDGPILFNEVEVDVREEDILFDVYYLENNLDLTRSSSALALNNLLIKPDTFCFFLRVKGILNTPLVELLKSEVKDELQVELKMPLKLSLHMEKFGLKHDSSVKLEGTALVKMKNYVSSSTVLTRTDKVRIQCDEDENLIKFTPGILEQRFRVSNLSRKFNAHITIVKPPEIFTIKCSDQFNLR